METPLIETQIVLSVPESGLEESTLATIRAGFDEFFTKAEEWRQKAKAIKVTSADQKGEMKLARIARLELKNIRVDAEKARKRLKEDSLRMGKAIDGINNVLLAAIVPLENYLEEQEKYGERLEAAAEVLAAEKKAKAAPMRTKIKAFANEVRALRCPDAVTPEAQAVVDEINGKVEGFAKWIEGRAATL